MSPGQLSYAEALKRNLITANQPYSAETVSRLLQERADLRQSGNDDGELGEQLKAAIVKARTA